MNTTADKMNSFRIILPVSKGRSNAHHRAFAYTSETSAKKAHRMRKSGWSVGELTL
jgi:hypothetical protein